IFYEIVGPRMAGVILGLSFIVHQIGSAGGPMLASIAFDMTGSYDGFMMVIGVILLASAVLIYSAINSDMQLPEPVLSTSAGRSSQLAARLETERLAGINSVDVFLVGVQTVANVLYPEKMLDPLKPQLILPEVVEPKRWKKGKLWFADPEERYVLRVYSTITGLLHINTDYVKPEDLTKAADLLQPKWRGKIATEDPTVAGSGSNTAARIYLGIYRQ